MHKLGEFALLDLYKYAYAEGRKGSTSKQLTEAEMLQKVRDWKYSRIGEIPNIKK